jgi:integrase
MAKRTRRAHGFSVYQRKDGRWGWGVTIEYDQVTGNAKRIQGIERTQKAAQEKAVAAAAKVKAGASLPQGRDQTLTQYLEQWLDLYIKPNREPKTVSYYSGMIKHHITPTLGRTPLRKLTAAAVQRVLNQKSLTFTVELPNDGGTIERRLSLDTVRGIRATLRSALAKAYKAGLVVDNVAQRTETPKGERKTAQHLSQEQATKLLKESKNHHLEGLITLAMLTGMRIGEVTGLRWDDVDFDAQSVRVAGQLQRVDKKLVIKRLKSERSHRTLHLPKLAQSTLQNERARQLLMSSSWRGKEPFNPMGLVFLNPEGRPLDPKFVDTHLKALMVKAELPPMSFHKLRHTAATLALGSGASLSSVRDQLGHSQISITADTYGHAVPTALREVAEGLERALSEKVIEG